MQYKETLKTDCWSFLLKTAQIAIPVYILSLISKFAVEKHTIQDLYERSGGRCESKMRDKNGKITHERCDKNTKLEVAHKQHGDNKRFNSIQNLELYCTRCHFLDHLYRSRNNLSKGENDWTLYQLWNRMEEEDKKGLTAPPIPKKNNHCKK